MTQAQSSSVESLSAIAWKRLRKNKGAVASLVAIGLITIIAIFAPIFAPMDPTAQVLEYSLMPSGFRGNVLYKINPIRTDVPTVLAVESYAIMGDSVRYTDLLYRTYTLHKSMLIGTSEKDWHGQPLYLLGTDRYGRDVLSRLIYGARVSLAVGLISQSIALCIGIVLGAFAGFFRGWTDEGIMFLVNVVWAFPTILLVIAISVVLGQGFIQTFIAIGISSWVDIARIVRGQFFSLREMEYVEATRALGYSTMRSIFRHILPNALGPITVVASAGFATAIISEASLSFLGLGVQPPTPSWGQMIRDGYGYIAAGVNWGLTLYPAGAIALTVFAFNIFGDGLRDALDPRTTQR